MVTKLTTRKPRNPLPLVNKALAIFQWKQEFSTAEQLCKEALQLDPDCDVAVATMAQLSLQQGKTDEAIGWFEKSGKLARTEGELMNAITCEWRRGGGVVPVFNEPILTADEHASKAQQAFLKVSLDANSRDRES